MVMRITTRVRSTAIDFLPDKGILLRGWDDHTLRIIQEKNRPVLLFVADMDPFVWPFLREIFKAMPANARLRQLLNDFYPALFIKADANPSRPQDTRRRQQLLHRRAVTLRRLTPMVTIEIQRSPEVVVRTLLVFLSVSSTPGGN